MVHFSVQLASSQFKPFIVKTFEIIAGQEGQTVTKKLVIFCDKFAVSKNPEGKWRNLIDGMHIIFL